MSNDRLAGLSSDEKRKLLMKALQKKSGAAETAHPLSLFQEGLLFLARLQPDNVQYNMPHVLRLRGSLDLPALERSIDEIVRRHAPLRTVFSNDDAGQPQQVVQPWQSQPLTVVDLTAVAAAERAAQAQTLVQAEGQRRFDLAAGPLFRYQLLRLQPDEHWLLFVAHHIIFDLLSLEVFIDELGALYQAFGRNQPSPLADLSFTYMNFARQQRQTMQGETLATQLGYWQRQLGGALPLLDLPTDEPRPSAPSGQGALYSFTLPGELAGALSALGRQEGASLYMTLLAGYSALLHRYTHQDDILIGTPSANRNRAELANLIGLLINTLVLRADLGGEPSFRQLIRRVQQTALDAYSHQDIPFLKLVETLQPDRSSGRTPIYQTMFALENAGSALRIGELEVELLDSHHGTAKYDLTLVINEETDALIGTFEYRTDLFSETTIARMAQHFATLLTSMVAQPDQPIATATLLDPADREQLLHAWNATARPVPPQPLAHDLVAEHALRAPDSIAVVAGSARLSYGELNRRADELAAYLRALSVGPDVLVATCLRRSPELLIAQLAVLKAGGAYVPIDPALPTERLQFLLQDSQAAVLLTERALLPTLEAVETGAQLICLDADWPSVAATAPEAEPTIGDHLAYVIYTSGSTGTPKGVGVTHANLLNLLHWHQRTFAMTAADRGTHLAGLGFDASVWEVWGVLSAGASLYLIDDETRLSPRKLRDWLFANAITVSFAPTPLAEELITLPWPEQTPLRYLLTGGDRLRSYPRPGLPFQLANMYGPTECTVLATGSIVPSAPDTQRAPTIGRPVDNTQVYVLDARMQPTPIGVPGELYIGGAGVARGYHRRPELTREKFIADPFSAAPGARLYRTGDRVRWLADGTLEYLGRIDQQVKIRGYRIELGEIEAVLLQHPDVREAAVVASGETDVQLTAYIVREQRTENKGTGDHANKAADSDPSALAQGTPLQASGFREFLKTKLPSYMVPASYEFLAALPLTPSGKLDRKALPAVAKTTAAASASAAPVAPIPAGQGIAQTIAAIWRSALGREQIGLHDNFFELGGHSLLLLQVHEQLVKALAVDLPLMELFTYSTVSALAQRIAQLTGQPLPSAQPETEQPASNAGGRSEASEIAVIGMAGSFPGAADVERFWQNLRDGVESIRWFSREELEAEGADALDLNDPNFVPAKGVMDGADLFDASFFGVTPRDAETMDPQQRVFLEQSWAALEHAGYDPERYSGRIGVYAGSSFNTYLLNNLYPNKQHLNMVGMFQVFITNAADFLTTRIAYKLNLKGPAVTVQTACSTSLVAVHMAIQALLDGECEMALVGGVSVQSPLKEGYVYRDGEVLSPDGHCHAFDQQARGTVPGTGVGVVILKRLQDAQRDGDTIHAVIKGSAINNDGALKVGYTAPSADGQAEVIGAALAAARVHPDTISYVEAHGTGTTLGDPIEVEGLTKAYRAHGAAAKGAVALGSVKTNVGHLDAAAGVTGLIKAVQALRHKQLPPSLNFAQPNSVIDWANSPFYVNTGLRDWNVERGPRRAGVSSFGVGGTNAHIILEEAPDQPIARSVQPWQLLTISARSSAALEQATANLREHLAQQPAELADVAHTLQVGRKAFAHRRIVVARDAADAVQALETADMQRIHTDRAADDRSVVFMFPGQGAQYAGMGRELYEHEPVFRAEVDRCAQLLEPLLGLDLRHMLFPSPEQTEAATQQLNQTWLTQPALFVIEYALAQLWQSWGVRPAALIGHSIGEYVAATLAGVFALEDALALVVARGRLIQSCPTGAMLSVTLPEDALRPLLQPDADMLSIAAVNGPSATVVAGPEIAIVALQARLTEQEISCRRLHTSHAFHSTMLDPILEPFTAQLSRVTLNPPRLPFISNLTGAWISAAQATDPRYWAEHVRATVRFADGLATLFDDPQRILLEVGPGLTLSTLARQQPAKAAQQIVLHSLRHPREQHSDLALLLQTLGRLWLSGLEIDWAGFARGKQRRRTPLPTYPFERQRYWIEAPRQQAVAPVAPQPAPIEIAPATPAESAAETTAALTLPGTEIEELVAQAWHDVLGIAPIDIHANFFELGGDSLMASRVTNRLRELLMLEVPTSAIFSAQTIASLAQQIETILVAELEAAQAAEPHEV
jgi:amino acid adenylation domain-containing protein